MTTVFHKLVEKGSSAVHYIDLRQVRHFSLIGGVLTAHWSNPGQYGMTMNSFTVEEDFDLGKWLLDAQASLSIRSGS